MQKTFKILYQNGSMSDDVIVNDVIRFSNFSLFWIHCSTEFMMFYEKPLTNMKNTSSPTRKSNNNNKEYTRSILVACQN